MTFTNTCRVVGMWNNLPNNVVSEKLL